MENKGKTRNPQSESNSDIGTSFASQPHRQSIIGDNESNPQKKNLWSELLKSVGVRQESKQAHLIILGDRGAGKRSLITSLNKPFLKRMGIQVTVFEEIGSDFSLFESSYLYAEDVNDYQNDPDGTAAGTGSETLTKINVWVINDPEMGPMLKKVLQPQDLQHTFAVIMPDLEQPWELMNYCTKWMQVLKDAIFSISPNLPLKTLDRLRERIVNLYKTYEEPQLDKDGKVINSRRLLQKKLNEQKEEKNQSKGDYQNQYNDDMEVSVHIEDAEVMEDLRREMELPEGILVTNLFIPVAVVCSKVDLVEHGEDKEIKQILEQNIDFIQMNLREFCLQYGATLLFASANSGSNVPLLYDYIIHRIFDTDFPHRSNIMDKEALFVPSGFDNPSLIEQINIKKYRQALNLPDNENPAYSDVIQKPTSKSGALQGPGEVRREIECLEWKKQLEIAYNSKVGKAENLSNKMAKVQAVGNMAGMTATIKKPAPENPQSTQVPQNKQLDESQISQPSNQSTNSQAQQTPSGERSNKMKSFYANLLNKTKTTKRESTTASAAEVKPEEEKAAEEKTNEEKIIQEKPEEKEEGDQ